MTDGDGARPSADATCDEQDSGTPRDGHSIVEEHAIDQPWEISPHGTPRAEEEFVCSVAEALEPDDEIIINGRSRSLRVLGFEEQVSPGVISGTDWPYHILWLRGNGTEYRLRWSHLCKYYPRLHTESELETSESYSIKHGEPRKSTRATGRGKRVKWIRPVDVDRSDLSDWAFLRNVDGLESMEGENEQ